MKRTPLEMKRLLKSRVVNVGECWEYRHSPISGYGRVKYQGARYRAHILSFTLFKRRVLDGTCVLHRCDNRACIRPSHLYAGTKKDNAIDYWKRNATVATKNIQMARAKAALPSSRRKQSSSMSATMKMRWKEGFYDNHRRWRIIRKRRKCQGQKKSPNAASFPR